MSPIEALLRERAGYVARGLPARVRSVDAELARLGYAVTSDVLPDEVEAAVPSHSHVEKAVRGRPRSR
jgi:hypothetical protein